MLQSEFCFNFLFQKLFFKAEKAKEKNFKYNDVQLNKESLDFFGYHSTHT